MPFGFNIGGPTSVDKINALIGSYATPEAAQNDISVNAPQGYDYLKSEYQRATGDSFADPFADASRARDAALLTAISAGKTGAGPELGISTSQFGPRILSAIPPTQIPEANITAPTGTVAKQAAEQTVFHQMLQNPQYQLPDVSSEDFVGAQARRASLFGVRDIFDELTQRNPEALNLVDPTNPELQLDAKGKPIAGDVLSGALFNDPKFQLLYSTQPEKAARFYKAIYGRDLHSDIESQVEANQKRTSTREDILKGLTKNLIFDDITGQPLIRTYKRDIATGDSVEGPPRELSAIEQAAITQAGGFKSLFGFEPPQGMNLTFDEQQALRQKRDEILQKNPNIPKSVALLQARKELAVRPETARPAQEGPNKLTSSLLGFQNIGRNIVNTGAGQANLLLSPVTGSENTIPLIPPVSDVNRAVGAATGDVFDWLKRFGREHIYSPSGSGNITLR